MELLFGVAAIGTLGGLRVAVSGFDFFPNPSQVLTEFFIPFRVASTCFCNEPQQQQQQRQRQKKIRWREIEIEGEISCDERKVKNGCTYVFVELKDSSLQTRNNSFENEITDERFYSG